MSTVLRVSALFAGILTVGLWFFGGLNLGRTQWVVPVEHPGADGHPRVVHETRFLPGGDFLSAGLAFSAALFAVSRWKRAPRWNGGPGIHS